MTGIPTTNANTNTSAGAVFGGVHLIPTNPLISFASPSTTKPAAATKEDSVQLSDFAKQYLQEQSSQQQTASSQTTSAQTIAGQSSDQRVPVPQQAAPPTTDQQESTAPANNGDPLVQVAAAGSTVSPRLAEAA